ncbi:hypothetical protein [Caldibacillus thermoamylovorans]|uniref:hypothetical protein n=1 Tax=Caldibacillus thermoamylovorans TaxID=35841 RepID=UPI0012E0AFD1|nr:hypothetical protein [Caldibacillus thermoamylovorans]
MATTPFLVVILRRKNHFFDDEIHSRHHFGAKNSIFWRRDPFSSTFLRGKLHFLATTPVLVDFFAWETPLFGDETPFRRHFCAEKSLFWRRDLFSSAFWGGKITFLTTRPVLVDFFAWETPLFGDDTRSRRHFEAKNSFFWRRDPFSSSF